ncbi:MAG: tRNA uridine-5-carboxymethylaminomethyl(34) synthesis GTPase MnmE [Candidatus Wallbacteria bacterium]|nr:tRNA uridine-5-carboxymethylaminomethyl(34) synthesis GTPase MnmE [Candidatus Wallbacteria bacterium]
MLQSTSDTIVALATPPVPSPISLIRLSGSQSIQIAEQIFYKKNGKPGKTFSHFRIYYGFIKDGEESVDEVLLHVMRAPHTYTGEDMLEITSHGSLMIQKRILGLLTRHGARLAGPGEFTRRAFINGKLDLVRAEAVNDLISAGNEYAYKIALAQLEGTLSAKIRRLRDSLIGLESELEAMLDFPDDVENVSEGAISERIAEITGMFEELLSGSRFSRVYWEGLRTVIIGPTNAGKSTLFNFLCREERAIVTEIPGTTRDFLEADTDLDGIPLKLVDTAGLRESSEVIEKIGMQRALSALAGAELVLLVEEAGKFGEFQLPEEALGKPLIRIANKIDLAQPLSGNDLCFQLSLLTGTGLAGFESALAEAIRSRFQLCHEGSFMVNQRQRQELVLGAEAVDRSAELISTGHHLDLVCGELRKAVFNLRSVLGEITSEEILDNIFSRFCIGK